MKEAFQQAQAVYMGHPNVNGVFIARRHKAGQWTDEPVIQIHVRKKLPADAVPSADIIPKQINGIATDVLATNAVPMTGGKRAAIQGGVSIGREEETAAGTLGLVIPFAGGALGVTAGHCLYVETEYQPTLIKYVLYPSQQEGGVPVVDRVGTPRSATVGMSGDYGTIDLTYPYGLSILGTTVIPHGIQDPVMGDHLRKVGRTTGVTDGQCNGTGLTTVDFGVIGMGLIELTCFMVIPLTSDTSGNPISLPGDSGSLWYHVANGNAAGLNTSMDTVVDNLIYVTWFSNIYGSLDPEVISQADSKGSVNLAVQNLWDGRGALNVAGAGPIFLTRVSVAKQDTSLVAWPPLIDVYNGAGIQFLGPNDSPAAPEETDTLPVWAEGPVTWNDFPNAWGDYSGDSGTGTSIVVPTYIDASHFSVPGNVFSDYPAGRKLYLVQGGTYDAVVAITGATSDGSVTDVTVDPPAVMNIITQIKFGPTTPASMPVHSHAQIQNDFSQTAHGFSVGQAIYRNGSTWALAEASTAAAAEAVGIISVIIDENNFTVVFQGIIALSGLTPGASYYLSASTPGALTTTAPDPTQYVSKPLMDAIDANTGLVINMRGLELVSG